jgi:translation initiation factor IF-3
LRRTRKQTKRRPETAEYRINRQIRVREVFLIDHNGVNHGVVSADHARDLAREAELDLVEVAPNANPPVCRILDYGKFIYEQTKKLKEARKRQTEVEIKTLKLTPRTGDFHRDLQVKKAREWLGEGKKVRFQVKFKARERDYPEIGQQALEGIAEELQDVSDVEQAPIMEGWSMSLMLVPAKS